MINYLIIAFISFSTLFKLVVSDVYRLPNNVRPIRFILTIEPNLDPDLDPAPYNGSVIMHLEANEDTTSITFNIRRLKIHESTIKVNDNSNLTIPVSRTGHDLQTETYTVYLDKSVKRGDTFLLEIGSFTGNLGRANVGFYLAKYKDSTGNERRLAVTDFEPNDAREAFPCFDEPGIKTSYVINVIRKKEFNSLSNEELERTIDLGNGRFQDIYKETPKMPAYVVAFIVSDFEATKLTERHRIFAKPGSAAQGKLDYSLDISIKTLRALEEFTNFKFPINKMDQFAIPDEYFKDDAMENFGLVIYGESHLFCTNQSAYEDLKRCTTYIAHEFGHQWFGNIVTPAWWIYTWLSEGFAGYLQFYIASLVQPSWRLMDQFVVENLHGALDRDNVGRNSKALNFEITYNGQFPTLWILYHKGGSIIRMTEHFMTHDVFKRGLQIYIEENKYKTATPNELYKALQKAINISNTTNVLGGLSISEILESWNNNPGYPLVTITRNYQTGSLTFQQTRFVQHEHEEKDSNGTTWHIPINFAFNSDIEENFIETKADLWLSVANKTLDRNFTAQGWILANIQQTGYYRVNYDPENWERLIKTLNSDNFKTIPAVNRAQLLDDSFDLARAGKLSFDVAFRLSEYLIKETDYIPFAAFFSFIDHMEFVLPYQDTTESTNFMYFGNYSLQNMVLGQHSEYDVFKEYVKYILEPTYNRLGFREKPTDSILDKINRARVAKWLCDNKYTPCTNDAVREFSQFKHKDTDYVAPNMRYIIFCKGVDSVDDWNFLAKLYKETTNEAIKKDIYDGLGCNHRYGSRRSLKT